jgi:FkbH-like protein
LLIIEALGCINRSESHFMDASEFLFPYDLAVTDTKISKVLLIGSCMAEAYLREFQTIAPNVAFEWVIFNNLMEIPDRTDINLQIFDFQYVQLPLRVIVSDEIINFSAFLSEGTAEAIIIRARQRLQMMLEAALKYNKTNNILTFVANFFVPQVPVIGALNQMGSTRDFAAIVRQLNDDLALLVNQYENVYVADVESVGGSLGKKYFLDDVSGFYSHAYYWGAVNYDYDTSPAHNAPQIGRMDILPRMEDVYGSRSDEMFKAIWRQAVCLYRIVNQIDTVKLVIFDLDDTMWRGQIGEHYGDGEAWPVLHGWPVGIWEAVQHLRARGIIVGLCSKNEESLVCARWNRAVLPWLSLKDFPLREINWKPKAENVANLIKSAGVMPRSTVFVDDNPVERESVKAALPDIRVLGSNPHVTRRILLWSPETQLAFRSTETVNREQSIRQMQVREGDRATLSREEFLMTLGCRLTVKQVYGSGHPEFARGQELINKTNQFNTTGVRWTAAQLATFIAIGGEIFIFSVTDKYTDYGVVGVILYRFGVFAQFAMSCRVLGLEIETSVIFLIMKHMQKIEGRLDFCGKVFQTDANMVCREVFCRCGFEPEMIGSNSFVWKQDRIPEAAVHLRIDDLTSRDVDVISEPVSERLINSH